MHQTRCRMEGAWGGAGAFEARVKQMEAVEFMRKEIVEFIRKLLNSLEKRELIVEFIRKVVAP
jgi:hypothetical protein